jgi:integrase
MSARMVGNVTERQTRRGRVYGLRFTAYGTRRHVTLEDGTTREQAEKELRRVRSEVERGVWQPPTPPPTVEPLSDPTFHEFATDWFEASKGEWRPTTRDAYESELSNHLLPFFKDHQLSQITIAEVDRYRQHKVAKGKLAATTINKTLIRLGQILEVALERELVARNSAKVGKRKLKVAAKPPVYLDSAEQVEALLDAAGELDAEAKSNGRVHRRAQLACLVLAGLRMDEHVSLDWRDVDLLAGRLHVRASKTAAGTRYVTLRPTLRDELAALKDNLAARNGGNDPADNTPVFPTQRGGRTRPDNLRPRILAKSVERANENLAKQKRVPLPVGLTPHKLRHTFASILYALGVDPGVVMDEMGHTDPALALRLYRHSMRRGEDEKAKLRALVNGEPVEAVTDSAEGIHAVVDV